MPPGFVQPGFVQDDRPGTSRSSRRQSGGEPVEAFGLDDPRAPVPDWPRPERPSTRGEQVTSGLDGERQPSRRGARGVRMASGTPRGGGELEPPFPPAPTIPLVPADEKGNPAIGLVQADRSGEDGDGEELSQSQRLAFNQDDRPSTGRTSSFALAPSISYGSHEILASDSVDTPRAVVEFGSGAMPEPTHEALMRRPPSRLARAEPPIDRVVMPSLRLVSNHAGLPLADVEAAYREYDATRTPESGDFAAAFCSTFAGSLTSPMSDPRHVSRVYFPEGFPTRAERRYRLMALHSRLHIDEVEKVLGHCEDRDSRSRDADLSVFSSFVAASAHRLPPEFPPLQELLEML